MTNENERNPPAFPQDDPWGKRAIPGMTLRDYFAGQALAGIMANPVRWEQIAADYRSGIKSYEQCSLANATKAYSLADAMLRARDMKDK